MNLCNATALTFSPETRRSAKIYNQLGLYVVSPTGNCQLGSYNNFVSIIHVYRQSKEDAIKLLTKISIRMQSKPLLLLDVRENNVEDVEQIFPSKFITLKAPYISSNGSKMCIFIVDLKSFVDNQIVS